MNRTNSKTIRITENHVGASVKKLLAILLAGFIIAAGTTTVDAKPLLYLQWQKASAEKCSDCDKCVTNVKEVKAAYKTLKRELADKGVKVKLREIKHANMAPATPSASNMWVGDVPLELWLDARAETKPCGGCEKNPAGGMLHSSLVVNGQTYDSVPANLMVQAGHKAADHLLTNGSIDPASFAKPAGGCGGCGSKSSCGSAKKDK